MSEPYARAIQSKPYVAFAFEQLTVTNSVAVTFTAATAQSCKRAVVIVETAAIRWRADGTAPTTTVGMLANAGDQLVFLGPEAPVNIKFIATSATSATLDVEYSR